MRAKFSRSIAAVCVVSTLLGPGRLNAAEEAGKKHVIVYQQAGRFCGWPANGGVWNWGDEILVGFSLRYYKESEDRHSIDPDKPSKRVFARSLDGGESWSLEMPAIFNIRKEPRPCPGGINFAHPDFAMKCRSERFYVSYDRGKSWEGPYELGKFGQKGVMARTDYIVSGKDKCLIFLTATKRNGKEGRPFCAWAADGAKTIEFVSWIAPEPPGYSIMPSTVRCSADKLVCAIRRYERGAVNRGWVAVYASNDNGRTWEFLSRAADAGHKGGNPPSLVRLPDGRLVVTYGFRSAPQGIRAKISCDEGKTWGDVIHLRDDGRTWDLGYTRTVLRADGKLVTIYYYTTKQNPQQHIAATIWDPDQVKQP